MDEQDRIVAAAVSHNRAHDNAPGVAWIIAAALALIALAIAAAKLWL